VFRRIEGKELKMSMVKKSIVAAVLLVAFAQLSFSEYGDIVLDRYKDTMAEVGLQPVVFPHWTHRIQFKCKACHEGIFPMKQGASDITMSAIIDGQYCGTCHNGKIAWDPLYCDRCHSLPVSGDGH
jgi:c(7)-type cytochrome triheme protein